MLPYLIHTQFFPTRHLFKMGDNTPVLFCLFQTSIYKRVHCFNYKGIIHSHSYIRIKPFAVQIKIPIVKTIYRERYIFTLFVPIVTSKSYQMNYFGQAQYNTLTRTALPDRYLIDSVFTGHLQAITIIPCRPSHKNMCIVRKKYNKSFNNTVLSNSTLQITPNIHR